jgi:hypothetical protein
MMFPITSILLTFIMLNYRTEYPNQVHQLTISVSRHYYVTKDRRLKYQQKDMDVSLEVVHDADRTHIIHYIIRDHFSGLFYYELGTSKEMISATHFLKRAWDEKSDYVFGGIPDAIAIPKTAEKVFPTLKESVAELGIEFVEVTSGFQGGIRDIRTVEQALIYCCDKPFDEALSYSRQLAIRESKYKSRNAKVTKEELFMNNVTNRYMPADDWGK